MYPYPQRWQYTDMNSGYSSESLESYQVNEMEQSTTSQWILERHNIWTKITLNSFYEECAGGTVTTAQFLKWLYDRYKIAETLVAVCQLVQTKIGSHRTSFYNEVAEDYQWFERKWIQTFQLSEISSEECSLTYGAQELIEYGKKAMEQEFNLGRCLLLVWSITFTFYQGWRMASRHYRCNQVEILEVAQWSCRDEMMASIIEMQNLLDEFFKEIVGSSTMTELALYFDGILARLDDMFEEIYLAKRLPGMKEYCSKCGRQGHSQDRCAFKGHI
eukprot:jgi/Galph1/5602/GphlegSOOS_G4245.1